MTIDVRFCGLEGSDSLRAHIARRLRSRLRRLAGALSAVVVRLSDVNGPRGGADKRCQVILPRPGLRPVTIEELSGDAYASVDLAIERAARAADRRFERARTKRRRARGSLLGALDNRVWRLRPRQA